MADHIIQKLSQITDADGRTQIEQTLIYRKTQNEPAFVKMYLQTAAHLRFLRARERDVLAEMLLRMDYNNVVALPGGVREDICRSLEMYKKDTYDKETGAVIEHRDKRGNMVPALGALSVTLNKLCKHKVIHRTGNGVFMINPQLFGKGKWLDVQQIRLNTKEVFGDLEKKKLPNSQKRLNNGR